MRNSKHQAKQRLDIRISKQLKPFSQQSKSVSRNLRYVAQVMAPASVPRNYHSIGLLLPDARVFNGGGGLNGNCKCGSVPCRVLTSTSPTPIRDPAPDPKPTLELTLVQPHALTALKPCC